MPHTPRHDFLERPFSIFMIDKTTIVLKTAVFKYLGMQKESLTIQHHWDRKNFPSDLRCRHVMHFLCLAVHNDINHDQH